MIEKWLKEHYRDLSGKTAVVTGANGGLGKYITLYLSKMNVSVIMACRNEAKAEKVKEEILTLNPAAKLEIKKLDISQPSSIDAFTEGLFAEKREVHYLVNNAGVLYSSEQKNYEGLEIHYATNYLGTARLTEKLLPLLDRYSGKILLTCSMSYHFCRIDKEDIQGTRAKSHLTKYAKTKRMLALYYLQLQKITDEKYKNVSLCLWHPGISATELFLTRKNPLEKFYSLLAAGFTKLLFVRPQKAALSAVFAVLHELKPNEWATPRVMEIWGKPKASVFSVKSFTEEEKALKLTVLH